MKLDLETIKEVLLYQGDNPLLFNTGFFLMLFLLFLLIFGLLRKFRILKMLFVISFSIYFYYKSSAGYCMILLAVCISDYVLGNLLQASKKDLLRRLIVFVNILSNVGMLVYFKYFNMLMSALEGIFSKSFETVDIILPAGISFFTFRSISYIVDIYRGHLKAEKKVINYLFYLTFFPPLLAGPVVRAKDMLPQIHSDREASPEMIGRGFFLVICGLIKKVVIADYISGNFVDRVFDNPSLYSGFENLVAMYGFTLQLYCDFSGYSDMAIGIALILGYEFLDNFDSPFKSQNPTEFWRRWHISLSSWLRDYLYIPMGGSRTSHFRSRLNLLNTMVIGGLWHGASWMFLIWGAWNGMLLVLHKEIKSLLPARVKEIKNGVFKRAANILVTFTLISFGMIFFRAQSMQHVGEMLSQIISDFHISVAPQFVQAYFPIVVVMTIGLLLHFSPHKWTQKVCSIYSAKPLILQGIILALVIFIVIQVRQSDIVPFIYLQY